MYYVPVVCDERDQRTNLCDYDQLDLSQIIHPLFGTIAQNHEHVILTVEKLTDFIEGKALRRKNANTIAQFNWDDVIMRHGCFAVLVSDSGTKFKNKILAELATRLNDLVLVYDSTLDTTSRKLDYRWMGPYQVRKIRKYGQVYLNELGGCEITDPITRNRVKKLFTWNTNCQEKLDLDEILYDFEDKDLEDEDLRGPARVA
ncbi:697_t:CDS:2 [Ambispora leptoticha]|uniref:697_t:CDS:1 n=1 Tax=Ambispora leptoticha TaxID=144679 RepID=A0A9N9CIZ4_9GLOM|nr:697_t:CDS:2 [Ambispora leptoticha]